jgi:hypothetical protein
VGVLYDISIDVPTTLGAFKLEGSSGIVIAVVSAEFAEFPLTFTAYIVIL